MGWELRGIVPKSQPTYVYIHRHGGHVTEPHQTNTVRYFPTNPRKLLE